MLPRPSETIDSGVPENMKNCASLRAYSHQAKGLKIKEIKRSKNKLQASKKIFVFARCEWAFTLDGNVSGYLPIVRSMTGVPISWLFIHFFICRNVCWMIDMLNHWRIQNCMKMKEIGPGECLAPLLSSISFIFMQKSCQIIVFCPKLRIWHPLSGKFWIYAKSFRSG